jgi:hypothetical protein
MKIKEKLRAYRITLDCYRESHPTIVFIGETAALIWGIPRWTPWTFEIQILSLSKRSKHGKYLSNVTVVWKDSHLVSSVEDTLLHLAVAKDEVYSLVSSISHCLKNELTSYDELVAFIDGHYNCSGITLLRHCFQYASHLDGSPLETYFRLAALEANFVDFEQQVVFFRDNGVDYYEVDFYLEFDGKCVAIELDGVAKGDETPGYYARQTQRDEFFRRRGVTMVHLMYTDLVSETFITKLDELGVPRKSTPPVDVKTVRHYRS